MQTEFKWEKANNDFVFKREIPGRVRMHTRRLGMEDFIRIDKTYPDQMRLKKDLFKNKLDQVFISRDSPATTSAKQEFLDMLVKYLPGRFPDIFKKTDGEMYIKPLGETISLDTTVEDPLVVASRLVQEDWCILEWSEKHENYVFTAGAVCFPMRWSILEKFEQPMFKIHEPVKAFKTLESSVLDLVKNMTHEKPVWRANWAVFNDLDGTLDLATPAGHTDRENHKTEFNPKTTGRELTFRAEYQTLLKLPKSKAIVFSIRTYQMFLEEFQQFPIADTKALIKAIKTINPHMGVYKAVKFWEDAAVKYLESIIDGTAIPTITSKL